jgi:hypothetical protein
MSGNPTRTLEVWTRRAAWSIAFSTLPLLLLEGPVHRDQAFHPNFACEAWWGFVPALGLAAGLLVSFAAKALQFLLQRDEGFYGD